MAGAANTYATRAELAAALGMTGASGLDDRLDLALIIASRWVDEYTGTDYTQADVSPPYTLTVIACPPSFKQATLAAASRFYKSTDVPFGVVGGMGDYAVRIKTSIPEAEAILMGQRLTWGIA